MLEGIGGPIKITQADVSGIDPTLDACCQREVEGNRKRSALEATLRRHDRIALAERRRQYLRNDLTFGSGCSCCYDHTDGGEYPALTELRSRQEAIIEEQHGVDNENYGGGDRGDGEESESGSDSDSEFDYLLDEDPAGAVDNDGQENQEIHLSAVMAHQWERMVDLQLTAMINESARQHGFGVHRQHHPQRVLQFAGLGRSMSDGSEPGSRTGPDPTTATAHPMPPVPAAVLHLFHPESMLSASLDLCLEKMSQTYRGTKFLRGEGMKTLSMNQALVRQSLPKFINNVESNIPALIAVRNGEVITICPKLTALGHAREETIEYHAVEHFLWQAGVLLTDVPVAFEDYCRMQKTEEENANSNAKKKKGRNANHHGGEDITQENLYCCGVAGCNKSYRHEHVGVKNEEQSGLLVSENVAIGNDDT